MKFSREFILAKYYLLMAIAFSLPFGRRFTTPIFLIWVIISFIHEVFRRGWAFQTTPKNLPLTLLAFPLTYYLLNCIGLFYSEDLHQGLFELEKKISFIAFPLFIFFSKDDLSLTNLRNIIMSFWGGLVICAFISIGLGFYYSVSWVDGQLTFRTAVNDISYERGYSFFDQVTQGGNYFFDQYISPFMHTTYYGMYLSFGVLISLGLIIRSRRKVGHLATLLFLMVVMLMTDSRGAIISFVLTLFFMGLIFLRGRYVKLILPVLFVSCLILLSLSPRTSLLLADLKKTISNVDYNATESAELRLILWRSSIEIIKDKWALGVGTGDAELAILEKTKIANKLAYESKLNAHNEYFETFICLGLIGIITLMAMIFIPVLYVAKNRNQEFAAFLMIVAFNLMFESMFTTFQGIVFFGFFYSVMSIYLWKEKNENIIIS